MFLTEMFNRKLTMPDPQSALPGRDDEAQTAATHIVNGHSLKGPYPAGSQRVLLGMGCFRGAERLFWKVPGVHVTAAGYAGGFTKNPTYQEMTTGLTGHAEVALIVYDPNKVSLTGILKVFFEEHDPTQGMRQGNNISTAYRSVVYVEDDEQLAETKAAGDAFQAALKMAGHGGRLTTEIAKAKAFYFADADHQQYLAKNPNGACGLRPTGVRFAI